MTVSFDEGSAMQSLRGRNDQLPEHSVSEERIRHAGGAGHRRHPPTRGCADAVSLRATDADTTQVGER